MRSTILARARAGGMIALALASASTAILLADFVAPSAVSPNAQPGERRDGPPPFTSGAAPGISVVCAGPDACTDDPLRLDALLGASSVATAPSFDTPENEDLRVAFSAPIESGAPVAVPEPSTFALVLSGLVALSVRRSRRLDSLRPCVREHP